jgi:alpha-glucosidase
MNGIISSLKLLCYPGILVFVVFFAGCTASAPIVQSPDGNIVFDLSLNNGIPQYRILFGGQVILDSSGLGMVCVDSVDFTRGIRFGKIRKRQGEDKYILVVGKTREVNESYRELQVTWTNEQNKKILFIARAYNDGIAFRYLFPDQPDWHELMLRDEVSQFHFKEDPNSLVLLRENFITSHEGLYTEAPLSKLMDDTLIDLPALFITPQKTYVAITEAALSDYAGMYLKKQNGILTSVLSPLPNQSGLAIKARLPHHSPWRVILIGNKPGALIESNLITNLCPSTTIKDPSWIKPGKTTFPWWNGNIMPDSIPGGNNFETNKYYIDFCARNGIEYHSIVEYGGHQWYVDDGLVYQPGPGADPTTPVPGLDMKKVCDYAHSQGVKPRVWVHWAALYPKLDTAFALYESWGLTGLMIDFMDRDDQEMVNIQEEMLQKAAKHKLHIQFHGAYKPTGMHRTYPNELTREGTLNYEVHKWDSIVTPDHDLDIVFTRMLAGSADFHLGGFRAVPKDSFKIQYSKPLMQGTRCHLLGMYVVMESYLQIVSDYPEAYEGQPGFEFIKSVPTSWDETRVLAASLREYVIIARRKGDTWFVGAINNHQEREINIGLDFLSPGKHLADIYKDADDSMYNPNHLNFLQKSVNPSDTLIIKLAGGGGIAIMIKR